MIINALNSGAKVFMADFEDALSPTWANIVEGQINLKDLLAGADRLHRGRDGQTLRGRAEPGGHFCAPARLALA